MNQSDTINLGYLPLLDAAPLLLAQELGYFTDAGLKVSLSREASWANIRDKLCAGTLQGAQLLIPMLMSVNLGLNRVHAPLRSSFVLNQNGNTIIVSKALRDAMKILNPEALASPHTSVLTLKRLLQQRRERGEAAFTFAVVYPFSCHNYLLRYWLAAGGIHPDHDVNLVVIPPSQMVAQLNHGRIDGFCAGEPWGQLAASMGSGHSLLSTYEVWHNAPEKVLAVHGDWADAHAEQYRRLLTVLLRTCRWLAETTNREEALLLLAQPHCLGTEPAFLHWGWLAGKHNFHQHGANHPWPAHMAWIVSQMVRWGHLPDAKGAVELIDAIFSDRLFRTICVQEGLALPPDNAPTQVGYHAAPWQYGDASLGADRFIDGIRFDSSAITEYLRQFAISNLPGE
ncbi:MAG TPA: CmpA/NrtA family ABC transporter substrate-binding protein [Candidatus Acidoferrum sp.]|nr:CmpA/NrtA family ABC transporter substrate-binding protein [Candidatus Acidoferrum sp.]